MTPLISANSFQFEKLRVLREFLYREIKIAKYDNILDIGAGDLKITKEISEKTRSVVFAIDLKKPQNIPENIFFVKGDALKLPFKEKSFSLICSSFFFVWQKEKEIEKALKEIKKVLKKNGILLILSEPIYRERKFPLEMKFFKIQRECYKKLGANYEIENDLTINLLKMGFKPNLKKIRGQNKADNQELLEEINFFFQNHLIDSQTRQILAEETCEDGLFLSLPVLYGWAVLE